MDETSRQRVKNYLLLTRSRNTWSLAFRVRAVRVGEYRKDYKPGLERQNVYVCVKEAQIL